MSFEAAAQAIRYLSSGRSLRTLVFFLPVLFPVLLPVHEAGAQSYESLKEALSRPKKVTSLTISDRDAKLRQLPAEVGRLINLKSLRIGCLPRLEDLPGEIGSLAKLERLVIDGGSGCQMNVALPESVGKLRNLRVLRLRGPSDGGPREKGAGPANRPVKPLPEGLAQLKNLSELALVRIGLAAVPSQAASLEKLEKLVLDENNLSDIPPFAARLKSLKELSLLANKVTTLPPDFSSAKGLKIVLSSSGLEPKQMEALKQTFPNILFNFAGDSAPVRVKTETHPGGIAEYLRTPNYRVIVTSGLSSSNEPLNNLKVFSLDEKTMFVYVMWYSIPKGVYHYMCKIYDGAGDLVRHTAMDFSPVDDTHFTYSSYQLKKNIDKPGLWRYEIFLNDLKVVDKTIEVLLH